MEDDVEPSELLDRAYKQSVRVPVDEQALFVVDALGARLAAAALGLKDTRTLRSWADGGEVRQQDGAHRLQVLYRLTFLLCQAFSPAVASAFWRGTHPLLGRAPLVVLADDPPVRSEPELLAAGESLLR